MKVKATQSCPTLCNPKDCSLTSFGIEKQTFDTMCVSSVISVKCKNNYLLNSIPSHFIFRLCSVVKLDIQVSSSFSQMLLWAEVWCRGEALTLQLVLPNQGQRVR